MSLINIPTRTSSNVNAAADVNDLMSNCTYLEEEIPNAAWPIGSTYIQVPTTGANGKSNTKTTAFPSNEEPGELYGGTWTQLFEDEGIFLKTEGDALSQTDGENNVRTNGLQTDAIQNIKGYLGDIGSGLTGTPTGPFTWSRPADGHYQNNVNSNYYDAISFDASLTVRAGKETRGRNRLMKVWKRTA